MMQPIVLIGAEFEENLSLRYLASAVAQDGFEAVLIPYNLPEQADAIVAAVIALEPLIVGISVPFQLRAREFLELAQRLRSNGLRAHITIGGHFATFEYDNILRDFPAIDSAVRHEGEETLRRCRALHAGADITGIAGTGAWT
jgi:radical SAM superfamily enzyme YgiQ (UPF0313 family)